METETGTRTVYVASAWWRDCDPFATVVAADAKTSARLIAQAIQDEAEYAHDSDEGSTRRLPSLDDYLTEICYGGTHVFELSTLNPTASELADLETDGYYWQEG